MNRTWIICLLLLLPAIGITAEIDKLSSNNDKINYSIGYQIGGDFVRQGIALNPDAVVRGIRDAMEATEPLISAEEMNNTLINLKKKIVADQRKQLVDAIQPFLQENRAKEGVVELPSGVQYRVLQAGDGPRPTMTDTVAIHYRTLDVNDKELASTYSAAQPKSYVVGKLSPGLRDVLPLMQQGAKWQVVIPPGHAGDRRSEYLDQLGVLIYEVELVAIEQPKG